MNMPHQGKKEIARRVRQNSGVALASVPRRMWSHLLHFQGYKATDGLMVFSQSSKRHTIRNHVSGEFHETYIPVL